MKISIAQVLVGQARYSITIDCSKIPQSMARSFKLILDRVNFFDLPRLIRDDRVASDDVRLIIAVATEDKQHAVYGNLFAFPRPLVFLVGRCSDYVLREGNVEDRPAIEVYKLAEAARDREIRVKGYHRFYGRWCPTLYYNPHLTSRYVEWVVENREIDDAVFNGRVTLEAAEDEANKIYREMVESDPILHEVTKELAIVLGELSEEDMNGEYREETDRVRAHIGYIRAEYPDLLKNESEEK